ncbi:GDNF family receptor alpha-like isoform X1 [Strigops habroptila]|uniref:GDNF family receptor alpha-like isoform X1 n=1 Tax=Strigops habroptila TaxID=2489341 RepID=UPI0011CFCB96|nr:GDNF family receptor alpha-like isoform X1 [Strigops habroptila]
MAALLCLVLFMYFTSISTAQTTDCLHLREQCINAANGCESVWNVVEDVCNISVLGNRCKAEDAIGCNRIIQVLADEYPEFKNCVCTSDDFCSITTLLGKQCSIDKEYLETSSRSDTELSFRQHGNPKDQGHPEELENDCSIAKQRCLEDPYCFLVYKSFQRACQADTEKCMLPMVNQACLPVWKELRKTVLGECKCSEPLQMRCIKVWKEIFNNPCLQYSQESQASAASKNDDDDDDDNDDDDDVDDEKNQDTDTDNISTATKLQWSLSALYKQAYTANSTCLDVNKECVEDEVCNKQLSLYLKACSVNKKCNMEECQAALRFFYQNMPFEVAQMMTFCDCTQPDESCHRAKELLHGKPCAVTAVPSPSCLNVIHMCEENDFCRKKYTAFRSKCWRHVTKKCYSDEACLETLIKDDMPCSANTDCKAAYISNWGTMLRVKCTCQNLPATEHSLCKLFQHMLHSKSCFSALRQISIKKKGFHWVNTEMPGEKLSRAQLHSSSINGETVYIIAYSSCIVLILGTVLLTLLKIRACRTKHESRSPSPDHSSETFMVHYKSHI